MKLHLGINIDHVATPFLSWPAGVRATQLGVWRDGQRMKYRPKLLSSARRQLGGPHSRAMTPFFDVRKVRNE